MAHITTYKPRLLYRYATRYIMVILSLQVIEGKLRHAGSQQVQFCSFSQDNDSVLKREEGRQRLREVGISTPETVGAWLVEVFRKDFGQEQLADRLEPFIHNNIKKAV